MSYPSSVRIRNEDVPLTVRISARARRMKIRVEASRQLTLIVPKQLKSRQALAFLKQEEAWLNQQLSRIEKPIAIEPGVTLPLYGDAHLLVHDPSIRGIGIREDGDLKLSGSAEFFKRRFEDWAKKDIKRYIEEQVDIYARRMSVVRGRITIRDQKSRWGSCSSKGHLNFSWRLIFMPRFVSRYIIAHEVAHLVHMDHSADFWALVETHYPEMKAAKTWLKKNGSSVHRY